MDSPAIRFDGEEKLKADNRSFTSDTLGIKLQPVYAAYADTASYATFILQNRQNSIKYYRLRQIFNLYVTYRLHVFNT